METTEQIITKLDEFFTSLVTPNFLSIIEKWARYNGEDFDIGDCDIYVKDKGIFVCKTEIPKIEFDKKGDFIATNETEIVETIYDVTCIKNCSVCSDNNIRLLIAERKPILDGKYMGAPRLYVFSISEDGDNYDRLTFETLKKYFEKCAGDYHSGSKSMLKEFCDVYSITSFNEHCDRVLNFTGLSYDLEFIEESLSDSNENVKYSMSDEVLLFDWENNYKGNSKINYI